MLRVLYVMVMTSSRMITIFCPLWAVHVARVRVCATAHLQTVSHLPVHQLDCDLWSSLMMDRLRLLPAGSCSVTVTAPKTAGKDCYLWTGTPVNWWAFHTVQRTVQLPLEHLSGKLCHNRQLNYMTSSITVTIVIEL